MRNRLQQIYSHFGNDEAAAALAARSNQLQTKEQRRPLLSDNCKRETRWVVPLAVVISGITYLAWGYATRAVAIVSFGLVLSWYCWFELSKQVEKDI